MPSTFLTGNLLETFDFSRFKDLGLSDVYYTLEYMRLHTPKNAELGVFVYQESDEQFIYPIQISKIPQDICDDSIYDFQTPYGYGGPLATSKEAGFLELAWASFDNFCSDKRIIAGFTRFHPLLKNHLYAACSRTDVILDRETVVVDLHQSLGSIEAGYTSGHRGAIKKANRLGVRIEARTDASSLSIFGAIYNKRMTEIGAHKSYFFDEDYFQSFAKITGFDFINYLAFFENEAVGGALIILGPDFAHYHLAAGLSTYSNLNSATAICARLISDLANNKRRHLHFGGGRSNNPKDGLFKFKAGFSPQRADFFIGTYVQNIDIYKKLRNDWINENPDKIDYFGKFFLCYRM